VVFCSFAPVEPEPPVFAGIAGHQLPEPPVSAGIAGHQVLELPCFDAIAGSCSRVYLGV
jgi:hypothetical protein